MLLGLLMDGAGDTASGVLLAGATGLPSPQAIPRLAITINAKSFILFM